MTIAQIVEEAEIRPISHQSTNAKVFELLAPHLTPGVRVLDLGAGEGFFSKMVGDHLQRTQHVDPATVLSGCDVTPEIFRYGAIPCDAIGADGRLPYPDREFDVVCSLEVIEHVEDQFAFCREIVRVLRPGGLAVLSTPNVLNLNSRYRNFHSGFAALFNPLSMSSVDVVHTSGHIHPVSYYYLVYAFHRAGARVMAVDFDRFKRGALLILLLSWPIVLLGNLGFRAKLRRKNPRLYEENAALIRSMGSFGMLTSRSIVVSVRT